MEEKLYFKPEPSKKKQTGQRVEKAKVKSSHRIIKLVCLLLFLLIIILIIIWLLRGKTTTIGEYPANIKNESLECISNELIYDKLGSFEPKPQETKLTVTAVFTSDDELKSISLKNLLTFSDNSEAIVAEARTHANFNIGLRAYNYSTSKFNNKFSIMNDRLLINLSAKSKEYDEFSKDYFLIPHESYPKTLSDFKTVFESQKFVCKNSSEQNNNS
ncbi:hypothetical protein IKG02_00655 [Candidatus Saccharibacteria bacterium]|nr:hypothetical protein [Candidatus Saccharibacteria bacterium]